jgi:dihydrofolate reductase
VRKLIVYIAMSVDGFIAGNNDDLSFLQQVEQEGEDYGYGDFIQTIDTVIIGRRTYDTVMQLTDQFPHADKACYIISSKMQEPKGNLRFYTGDLHALVAELKATNSDKHIFCDGGASIVQQLLRLKLVDELIVSIIPVVLGDGIRLFGDNTAQQQLTLLSSKAYPKGLVQLQYQFKA